VVFERETGQIRWRAALPTTLPNGFASCSSAPAVSDRTAYISLDDGRILAYDLQAGQNVWTIPPAFPFPAQDDRPLAVIGNVLIAGSARFGTYAFNATTGTALWQDRKRDSLAAQMTGEPWTADDSLVVGASVSGWAFAYVPTSGARRWVVPKGLALDDRGFWPGGVLTPTMYVAATTNGMIAIRR
jgi:outer membrane protein assembly factor BamB